MYISDLKLENYKNLDGSFELYKGINVLIAPNGTGKTNLLEAIDYVSSNSSFRGVDDSFVYPVDQEVYHSAVEVTLVDKEDGVSKLRLVWQQGKAKVFFFDQKKSNSLKFSHHLVCLVHAPQTMDVVAGPAKMRRDFLDHLLTKLRPKMRQVIKDYSRSLRQKNRLLRLSSDGRINRDIFLKQLNFWNHNLADNGAIITYERINLLLSLFPVMQESAQKLYGIKSYQIGFDFSSKYYGDIAYRDEHEMPHMDLDDLARSIFEKLDSNIEKESIVGRSLYGSHLDHYEFILGGKDVRNTASRGQQRLFSLILHLASVEMLTAEFGDNIILLLDDILSELDETHRKNTLDYLSGAIKSGKLQQVILTSPDKRDFPKGILSGDTFQQVKI